ncbi:MAG: AarF/ABC1/UbiB kinase family protein [Myxococcales bacterium]|nr:AarF/ABC1/UbiB kinase family protein [Myxococcales bacterium]
MSDTLSLPRRLERARRISATFGRIYLGIKANQVLARRLDEATMRKRWSRHHRESARAIHRTALDLRGLILKGCQFLGSRADVLPREYVEVLSRLQDRVPPRPFRTVRETVESELGRPLEEVFPRFSRRPIASASLAQVHEAELPDGRRVAVKVQYPEIGALVRSDLANLRTLFRAVGFVERDFDLMPLVEELGTYVPRELDFLNEGRNAETAARNFAARVDVRVPEIVWEASARRVLVMEFMDGIKITDTEALDAAGVDRKALSRLLADCFCEQIFSHGFFHADPHPGNLLVEASAAGPRLILLDHGLAKDLPPRFREGVVAFVAAMFQEDAGTAAAALLDLGFETRDGSADSLEAVAEILLTEGRELRKRAFLDRDRARAAGHHIEEIVRKNPIVRIPSHLVLLGRVVGLLSGVGRSLGAEVNLLEVMLPYALAPPRSPAA